MRLVDADKIIQEIIQEISKCEEEIKDTQDFQREIYLRNAVHFDWYLIEYLKHQKAVEERKHGLWRVLSRHDGKTDYECTACKGILEDVEDLEEGQTLFEFCPNCGAIMDEVSE